MQPDDDASLTLSKWPFYLGDVLLVLTALAIAILSEWQLSDVQVIACVISVALGAAIFVLPYVVEYSMRIREEQEDHLSKIRLLKGYLQKTETALRQDHERFKDLESHSGSVAQQCELLRAAMDQTLQDGAQTRASLHAELAALEERLTQTAAPLNAMESRLLALEEASKRTANLNSEAPKVAANQATVPSAAPRPRRKSTDSGLLQRAIQQKQNAAATAVSRIIDPNSQLTQPEAGAAPASDTSGAKAMPPSSLGAPHKTSDTICTVHILIGIGNKPFLRGHGAGLSREVGVPMDFEAIGKWRWVAPADWDQAVELQVYLNDQAADRKGSYHLQPGQKLEITPVF